MNFNFLFLIEIQIASSELNLAFIINNLKINVSLNI